ncbi:MAG: hypothetical protein RL318_2267, partial [Fibrobacterota bacterium]
MKNWQEVDSGWTRASRDGAGKLTSPSPTSFPSVGTPAEAGAATTVFATTLRAGKDYLKGSLHLRVPCSNGPVKVLVGGQHTETLPPWTPAVLDLSEHTGAATLDLALEIQGVAGQSQLAWGAGEGEALEMGPALWTPPKVLSVVGVVLRDVAVRPDFHTERVRISLDLVGKKGQKAQLSFKLQSPDNQKNGFTRELVLAADNASSELEFEVPNCVSWTPEQPQVYQLELSLDGVQVWKVPFAFAAPVWVEKGITLNDMPLFLRGVRWDAAGQAGFLSCANPKSEFARMKDAGFNAVFPASAPFPESFLIGALQAGLLVIQNLGLGSIDPANHDDAVAHSARLILRQEFHANVLGFAGADVPGRYLENSSKEWLRDLLAARNDLAPKGVRKDMPRTVVAHCSGTRLEVGRTPTQDPVVAVTSGSKSAGALELHRFRLPAPVSVARQTFLSRHLHGKDPSDLVAQGLGDSLFWKKLQKSKVGTGKFLAARISVPSLLDPDSTLNALVKPTSEQEKAYKAMSQKCSASLSDAGLSGIWNTSQFAAACQQIGGQATLRQADALMVNPRCAGWIVHQWADTPKHSSGLVGLAGQTKPGFDWFKRYNRHTRVVADAAVRTPYTMQSAGVRIHFANETGTGDYALLLRVKGNNGRIWHQESLPASSERGLSSLGKFEFPVGDEKGSFSFDMQLSRNNRELFHTVEAFYVPHAVQLDQAANTFRLLGDFPAIQRWSNDQAKAALIEQVAAFDSKRLKDLLDEAYGGLTLVFAPLSPEDARFLNRHGDLDFQVSVHSGASAGGEGYHYLADSALFARLPSNALASEVYADILPAWTLSRIPKAKIVAGFAGLQSETGGWDFMGDIQLLPYGKGQII